MTVVMHLFGPADDNYARRFCAGFSMFVVLEIIRYSVCNSLNGYFMPENMKLERQRVSCLCLFAYATISSAILAAFETSTYGESFVLGMVMAVLTWWQTYNVLFYVNPCWRRLSVLGDIALAAIVWGLVLFSMASV